MLLMAGEYKNAHDVLTCVHDVLVLNMLDYAIRLETELNIRNHDDIFLPSPNGLYFTGNIEPFMVEGKVYYPRSQFGKTSAQLKTIKDFKTCNDDIVNANNEVVFRLIDKKLKAKYIKEEPTIPVNTIKACIAVVLNYVNNLCPVMKRKSTSYHLEQLIKSSHHSLIHEYLFETILEDLLDTVMDFVDNDTWSMYFHKVKGTTLIIEKGADYRIYEWYLSKEHNDESTQEAGT